MDEATRQKRIDRAVRKFRDQMQALVDKGDMGRVTVRAGDGPEIVVAEKKPSRLREDAP